MGHTTVAQKGSDTGSVKRHKESEKKSISDRYPTIGQQLLQQQVNMLAEAVNNRYAFRSYYCFFFFGNNYRMPVRNALPFSFFLSFDRAGAPGFFVPLSYGS